MPLMAERFERAFLSRRACSSIWPQAAPAWKLSVATETVESWVRAEVVNAYSISETLISGRAIVRYDIQNAPRMALRTAPITTRS